MLGDVGFRHVFPIAAETLLANELGGHAPGPDLRVTESDMLGVAGISNVPLGIAEPLLAKELGGRLPGLGLRLAEPGDMRCVHRRHLYRFWPNHMVASCRNCRIRDVPLQFMRMGLGPPTTFCFLVRRRKHRSTCRAQTCRVE